MKKMLFLWVMILAVLSAFGLASYVLAAYSAHQNDQDINNFLAVYPFAKSTKLDDCALCHKGGTIGKNTYNSCDYCHHLLQDNGTADKTLNPYGVDYLYAGGHHTDHQADQAAIKAIESVNSDGDGYTNIMEIQALTFPGDPNDYPGLISAPVIGLNLERILRLPDYSEFLLLNAMKDTDWYARYRGVKIMDLLRYAGVPKDATGITVFAPDGFSKYFPMDVADPQTDPLKIQYDVMGPYPYGYYYPGLDFVNYAFIPWYLCHGNQIPDKLFMLLAYLRDGDPLTPGKINPTTLSLDGEGPYRLIPPQKIAGAPDRSSRSSPVGDGWDYDPNKDHNAGSSVRAVAAIKVWPLPDGTTDFNWNEGGWNLVDHAKLVIYGAINPRTYWVWGKVADSDGKPVGDVQISFVLISLGQVGADASNSYGTFWKDLPEGEYVAIPSKPGCAFEPESIKFQLSPIGYRMEFTAYCAP
jgi:hypothetical protein